MTQSADPDEDARALSSGEASGAPINPASPRAGVPNRASRITARPPPRRGRRIPPVGLAPDEDADLAEPGAAAAA